MNQVIVNDISKWQDRADFRIMRQKSAGVILRAGPDRNSWEDVRFREWRNQAESLNFPYGNYWYYLMSNFAGTWTRADYVNENGLPPEIQLQPMSTGGNLLKVIGETTFRQLPHYIVEAINPNVEFRRYHPSTHPWLFFRPTISVREWIPNRKGDWLEKREYFNEPFDDYGENAVLPVFGFRYDVRSSTKYTNIILKSRVRVLGATEPVPNPYRLRFGRMKPNPYAGF